MTEFTLTPRWTPLRFHGEQNRLWNSGARFKVVPAGRRSGKSELCKRSGVLKAWLGNGRGNGRYVFSAPTNDQAVSIYWDDVKALVPPVLVTEIWEGRHKIVLVNGSAIQVCGLDRPQRIEGSPVDWIAIDEVADLKKGAWQKHVRPLLDTDGRPGDAWLLGVPEGRNEYFDIYTKALEDRARMGAASNWDVFHWKSAEILTADVIAQARHDLDELSFQQEYEASFVNFAGRAYYPFEAQLHAPIRLPYQQGQPLIFGFDFNVEPGVAAVMQERMFATSPAPRVPANENITCAIGEVWIPKNSNTPAVARKLIADWGPDGARAKHVGDVYCYGDATGGNRGTAKLDGSDWDLLRALFRNIPGWKVHFIVDESNPPERSRVNAVNSRLEGADRSIHMLVDPLSCPQIVKDFEGVVLLEGGSGEIEKDHKKAPERTHISDAVGYVIAKKHPVVKTSVRSRPIF